MEIWTVLLVGGTAREQGYVEGYASRCVGVWWHRV